MLGSVVRRNTMGDMVRLPLLHKKRSIANTRHPSQYMERPWTPLWPFLGVFSLVPALPEHATDRLSQLLEADGLQTKRIDAQGLRLPCSHGLTEPGAEDDREGRSDAAQRLGQGLPGHLRHGVIRNDQIKALGSRLEHGQGLATAGHGDDLIAQGR